MAGEAVHSDGQVGGKAVCLHSWLVVKSLFGWSIDAAGFWGVGG